MISFDKVSLAVACDLRREAESWRACWDDKDELLNRAGYAYQLFRLDDESESHEETLDLIAECLRENEYDEIEIARIMDALDEKAEDWLGDTIIASAAAGGWFDELPEDWDDIDELLENLPVIRRLQLIQAIQSLL